MKKLIAFLLAGVMVFALASCGGGEKEPCKTCVDADGNKLCDSCGKEVKEEGKKPDSGKPVVPAATVADFATAIKDMNASRVKITITETSALGSLESVYTVAFGSGDRATISYTRQLWDVSEDIFSTDTPAKTTVSGTVDYADGAYSGSMNGAADAVAKVALNLAADKLANAQINGSVANGAQLIATVTRANSAAVLGVTLPADATLSVTMNPGGQSISAFTLSYADGANQIAFGALYQ